MQPTARSATHRALGCAARRRSSGKLCTEAGWGMAGRLAPTPTWLDQYGVNSSFLFQRGHGYMSLRLSDCVEPIFDIGHIFGPQPLYRCLAACQSTRGCGVLSFFQIPAKDRLSRHPRGFCLLKSERCLTSTNNLTFGSCAMRQPSSRRRFV